MKKTGWYTGDQKPVRVGVYEREYPGNILQYCWWDGDKFGEGYGRVAGAERNKEASWYQNLPWRGVKKP